MNAGNGHMTVCSQCGLPYGGGGVTRRRHEGILHFCCYGCSFTHSLTGETGERGTATLFLLRLGISAFLAMNVMLFSWVIYADQWHGFGIEPEAVPYVGMLLFVLSTPVILLMGYPFLRNGVKELLSRHLSMDSLIALGSIAAYGYSSYEVFTGGEGMFFDTATMIIVLVTAGRYLEASAKVRSTQAIRELMEMVPDEVRVIENGTEAIRPIRDVPVGSVVRVLPGEYIPLDGKVTAGETSVNEAILTGEPVPGYRTVGDDVFAGTINIDGAIRIRTSTDARETVYARIIRLMEDAQRTRTPLQKLTDRISSVFIPAVILTAVATFVVWSFFIPLSLAMMYALAVLVVACPCALGIGSPIAAAIAIGRAAANGILIKSASAMERIGRIRTAVFDKTGTVTKGDFEVTSIMSDIHESLLIGVAASIERNSEHPLSQGIRRYAERKGYTLLPVNRSLITPGMGIRGEVPVNGAPTEVLVGSREFMSKNGIATDRGIMQQDVIPDATFVYTAWDGRIHGIIALGDRIQEAAHATIPKLRELGIRTVLLSGDREAIVIRLANLLGFDEASGGNLPDEKIGYIRRLRETQIGVLMAGDGINDAPALAAADVGVTFGSGTDIAKENADITILGPHLEKIPWLILLSRKTRRIISWNLVWAFGYNMIAILAASFGYIQPIIAAFAMILSSLMVVGNSLRLKTIRLE